MTVARRTNRYPIDPIMEINMIGFLPILSENEPSVPAVNADVMPMTESDLPNHTAVFPLTS